MLEIIFDKNDNNEFLNQTRPVIEFIDNKEYSFDEYRLLAKNILQKYENEQIILVRNKTKSFSSNLFAVALFVQSCLQATKTECVVFKTKEYETALKAYRPYVALTIALKFAVRLYNQSVKQAYREMENMSYLGINIKKNYETNVICMNWNNKKNEVDFTGTDFEQSIITAATLKAYSLLKVTDSFKAIIHVNNEETKVDINEVINKIVQNVVRFVDRN
ncbi:MAG: hypothetical protein IJ019_02400 [Alphaproteobacteria bacterium]|nr:hypothetical protein [Alphaproteobacteria bacterium]